MSASTPAGRDPVFNAVDGLVRDGTLDHRQADRVYAVMRVTPGAAEPTTGSAAAPGAGQPSADTLSRWPLIERMAGGLALFGAGVAVAAAMVGTFLASRFEDGFEWQPFVVALGVALALAALTAGVHVLVADHDYARWLIAGPAGLGVLALALTVWVAFTDWDHVSYLVGAVLLLGGAGAYVVIRSGATVAVTVFGGLVLMTAFLGDVQPSDADSLLWFTIPAVLYGAVVAGAGWVLPTRHLSAVLGGVIALSVVFLVLAFAAFARLVVRALAGSLGGGGGDSAPDYSGDAATTLALGIIVCLALLALYALTGHTGYAVLGGVGVVGVLTAGLFAVDLDNTLRWAGGVGVLGVLIAAGAGLFAINRRGRPRRARAAAPPPPPQQPPPAYPQGDPAQTQVTTPYPQQPYQQPYQEPQQPYQQPYQQPQQPQPPYEQPTQPPYEQPTQPPQQPYQPPPPPPQQPYQPPPPPPSQPPPGPPQP